MKGIYATHHSHQGLLFGILSGGLSTKVVLIILLLTILLCYTFMTTAIQTPNACQVRKMPTGSSEQLPYWTTVVNDSEVIKIALDGSHTKRSIQVASSSGVSREDCGYDIKEIAEGVTVGYCPLSEHWAVTACQPWVFGNR